MVMIFEKVMVMGGYKLWLLVVMGYGYGFHRDSLYIFRGISQVT